MLPLQADPIADALEAVIEFWEAVPLFVWILGAILFLVFVRNALRAGRRAEPLGDDRIDRRENPSRVSREKYSIHDNVDDPERSYREPSEYESFGSEHEVDRGILAKLRNIVEYTRMRRRERE